MSRTGRGPSVGTERRHAPWFARVRHQKNCHARDCSIDGVVEDSRDHHERVLYQDLYSIRVKSEAWPLCVAIMVQKVYITYNQVRSVLAEETFPFRVPAKRTPHIIGTSAFENKYVDHLASIDSQAMSGCCTANPGRLQA